MTRKPALRSSLGAASLSAALILLASVTVAAAPRQAPAFGNETELPAAPAAIAQYDSGWEVIAQGACHTFNHNLGGDPDHYSVEVWFLADSLGINRRGYGGLDLSGSPQGAHWEKLTASSIDVCRAVADPAADRVRVRVWIPDPAPDYASPWTDITPGYTIIVPHNLGLATDNLSVSLWFRNPARGIHNLGYGGLAINATHSMHGAYWHDLTENEVRITRFPDDIYVEQVRVVVTQTDRPSWDSGWQPIVIGPNPFNHSLNVDPNLLLVRGECRSAAKGIHQLFAGGTYHWSEGALGTHLQNLAANSVVLVRWADDNVCPEARVRVWLRGSQNIFLPLVLSSN